MSSLTKAYVGKRITLVTGPRPTVEAPALFAANHPTTLDPLLLRYALGLSYSALVTEAAFQLPLVRDVLVAGRNIPVGERGTGGKALIETAARTAREGRHLAVFPEGCLSPESGLAPLRTGTVRIASLAGLPVLPIGIAVSRAGVKEYSLRIGDRLETGRYLLGGWYVIRVGKPLSFSIDPEDRQSVRLSTVLLGNSIRRLVLEARGLLATLEGREDPEGAEIFAGGELAS